MKSLLAAAAVAALGFAAVPAFANCGAPHPQALSAPANTVLAQAQDTNPSTPSDQGNQSSDDDDN